MVTAFTLLLHRLRSFKVTNFGTNRKLIYHFLLVINANLPPILHRFQVMAVGWLFINFSPARGKCLILTFSLGVVPCYYQHKWYIAKNNNNYMLWPTFLPQKVSTYLQPLLRNPPRKLPSSVKLRNREGFTPFKAIEFGTNRKVICSPTVWNSLPASLRTTDSFAAFCRQLKTFLFDSVTA